MLSTSSNFNRRVPLGRVLTVGRQSLDVDSRFVGEKLGVVAVGLIGATIYHLDGPDDENLAAIAGLKESIATAGWSPVFRGLYGRQF
jgi:hypothetical protein